MTPDNKKPKANETAETPDKAAESDVKISCGKSVYEMTDEEWLNSTSKGCCG